MLKVGQKLWWVPSYRGQECEVTVIKVGRKWAELSNRHHIDIKTLAVDGGQYNPPGRCYVDGDAYRTEKERQRTWQNLYSQLRYYSPPADVTTADITAAAALLKIDIGGKG